MRVDVERMRRANQRRLIRGRWTQEEVDAILARAQLRAWRLQDLVD